MQKKREKYEPKHLTKRIPLLPEGDLGIISMSIASIILAVLFLIPCTSPAGREDPDGPAGITLQTPADSMLTASRPIAAQRPKPIVETVKRAETATAHVRAKLEEIHAEAEAEAARRDAEREAARLEAERVAAEQAKVQACIDANPYYSDSVPLSAELQLVLYEACQEHDIPYRIGLGLIDVESDFDENALNPDTLCYGLCQINPEYWPADLGPADNVRKGMEILRIYLDSHGQDMTVALTCYHAGHDNGDRTYADAVFSDASKWAIEIGI